ncbi:Serine peptidase inhibitor, Kunitz type 2 [Entomophthora muscae]|uniref:Serine peptidase inhibitor, Kunitz type 2 n=1 Tax=Entomophthora muscae TaxID=34485 RepID=A0ACC2SIU5_9FUNG|nr:Serine peptidase inhibitor, Kunitz type 2 [Entomophthora muscae]
MKLSLTLASIPCLMAAFTDNNKETCARASGISSNTSAGSERCYFKLDTGMCRGFFPSYYFNWETRKCEEGTYGGCGGCSPFESEEECETGCKPLFQPTKPKRKCRAYTKQY